MNKLRVSVPFLVLSLMLFNAACEGTQNNNNDVDNGGDSSAGDSDGYVQEIAVEISASTIAFDTPDLSETLTATVSGTSDTSVTWSTADEYIATVSSTGVVTSVAGGTVAITATSTADTSRSAVCTVTVSEPSREATTDAVAPDAVSGDNIEIVMCGDSLMRTYDVTYGGDQCGWGQVLQDFFDSNVTVNNDISNGGRSSRSFYNESVRWPVVKEILATNQSAGKPTFVFIQFGHNDEKTPDGNGHDYLTFASSNQNGTVAGTYYDYLERYVVEARSLGGIPVLFTPFVRRYLDADGAVTDKGKHNLTEAYVGETKGRGDYPAAMKAVAAKHNVPVIDLTSWSEELIEGMYAGEGVDSLSFIYSSDNTHTRTLGALKQAEAAVKGLSDAGILDQYMVVPEPRLMLDAGSKSFGDVVAGRDDVKNIKMTSFNVSEGSLTITSDSTDFTLCDTTDGTYDSSVTLDCTLSGGNVFVRFAPAAIQEYTGTLTATYSAAGLVPDFGTSPPGETDAASAYIALSGAGIEDVPYTGSEFVLNVGDLEDGTLEDGATLGTAGYFSVNGTPTVEPNSKTVDGVPYTKRLKTGGSSNSISLTTSNQASIYVVCISSNSSTPRTLQLLDGTSAVVDTFEVPGTPAVSTTFSLPSADTYTLKSASGGINFYYFRVNEAE